MYRNAPWSHCRALRQLWETADSGTDRQTDRQDIHFPQGREEPRMPTGSGRGSQDTGNGKLGHWAPSDSVGCTCLSHVKASRYPFWKSLQAVARAHTRAHTHTHTHTLLGKDSGAKTCNDTWYPLGGDAASPPGKAVPVGGADWKPLVRPDGSRVSVLPATTGGPATAQSGDSTSS